MLRDAQQQLAKNLTMLALERGQLESYVRNGSTSLKQIKRQYMWASAAAAQAAAAAAAGDEASSRSGLGNLKWEDSEDEDGIQVWSLKGGVPVRLPSPQGPWPQRPLKVITGPGAILFPLVLLKGLRAGSNGQLPQDLMLAAASAGSDNFPPELGPCCHAVFGYAMDNEGRRNHLLEAQMRAAAAVCLQALAAIGVVNPTWSTLGFDQPEARRPPSEEGQEEVWGPLGLRQVVALLSEQDQEQVGMALDLKWLLPRKCGQPPLAVFQHQRVSGGWSACC
jgi:hypothetical protein